MVSASLDQTVRVWDISGLRKKTVAPGGDDVLRLPQVRMHSRHLRRALIRFCSTCLEILSGGLYHSSVGQCMAPQYMLQDLELELPFV